MGGSYSGYAGLAFIPDLYACGVDIVGPSNIFTLLENLFLPIGNLEEPFYME